MSTIDGYVDNRIVREQRLADIEQSRTRVLTILEFGGTVSDSMLVLFDDCLPSTPSYGTVVEQ